MYRVYKYTIENLGENEIEVPENFKPLSVQDQQGTLCLWAMVEVDSPKCKRVVHVIGTGFDISEGRHFHLVYLGTVQQRGGEFVWHVFIDRKRA